MSLCHCCDSKQGAPPLLPDPRREADPETRTLVPKLSRPDRAARNQVDLVSAQELEAVTTAVRRVNGSALMFRATNAQLPLEQLLGLHAFSTAHWQQALAGNLTAGALEKAAHGGGGVLCVCLRSSDDLEFDRLQGWMQSLVARQQEELYRLKGLLAIAGEKRRFVLHGVHAQVVGFFEREFELAERESVLVLIGLQLDAAQLEQVRRAVGRRGSERRAGRVGRLAGRTGAGGRG